MKTYSWDVVGKNFSRGIVVTDTNLSLGGGKGRTYLHFWDDKPDIVSGSIVDAHPIKRGGQLLLAASPARYDGRHLVLIKHVPVRKDGSDSLSWSMTGKVQLVADGQRTCSDHEYLNGNNQCYEALVIVSPGAYLSVSDGESPSLDKPAVELIIGDLACSLQGDLQMFNDLQEAIRFIGGVPIEYL